MMNAGTHLARLIRPRVTRAGLLFLLVSLWGCWAIHNATRGASTHGWFVLRQLVWIVFGGTALFVTSGLDYRQLRRAAPWLAGVAWAGLVLVLLFGIRINGMKGWFSWRGLFLQPSEIAKPVFVLTLAAVMDRTSPHRKQWLRGYGPCLAVFLLWILPIACQPDFGAVLVYGVTFAVVYWCLGGRVTHLAVSALAALPAVVGAVHRHPYVKQRLLAYLNPEAYAQTCGWHLIQFRRTLASGGLFGSAWGHGEWSHGYLPLGYSDSIFASTAERLGFFGVLPLLILILGWAVYGCYQACRARSEFSSGVIVGMVALLTGQAFIHLSVNLGLLPPTGITLPLVSYGGSSLLATMIAVGTVESMVRGDTIPAAAATTRKQRSSASPQPDPEPAVLRS
jgi:cell division protein FtsW